MSGESWRYVDSGPASGVENMAVDEAMLEAHAAGDTSPSLRVYTWQPAAVSLGRFQPAESTVDLEACRRRGIDVVRRPTGGRAILHTEEEVTFSVVVSAARVGTSGVMDTYRALAGGIVAAVRRLGLDASLVERSGVRATPAAAGDPACFAVKARCDLVVGSAKLVGSAQVQRNGFVLQQNSLPLRIRLADWDDVFLRPMVQPEATGLWEAANRKISYDEVAAALREGFSEALRISFAEGGLSEGESERARELREVAAVGASRVKTGR